MNDVKRECECYHDAMWQTAPTLRNYVVDSLIFAESNHSLNRLWRLTPRNSRNIVGDLCTLPRYWLLIIMSDELLLSLETKLDRLILLTHRLQQENAELKARESEWQRERVRLVEKNELARSRVEAMITHLKNLDAE